MYVDIEDLKTGWFDVGIGLKADEIDLIIQLLNSMKSDKSRHFHFASDCEGSGGISDIEFYIQNEDQSDNMAIM